MTLTSEEEPAGRYAQPGPALPTFKSACQLTSAITHKPALYFYRAQHLSQVLASQSIISSF